MYALTLVGAFFNLRFIFLLHMVDYNYVIKSMCADEEDEDYE